MLLLALLASAGPGAARMTSSQHKADAKAAAAAADSGGVTIDVSEAVDVDSAWKALAKGLATDHLRYYAGSLLLALCARCASNHQTRPMTHAL